MEKTTEIGRRALLRRLMGTTAIALGASALLPAAPAFAQAAATPIVRRLPLANIATPPAPSGPLVNPAAIVAASDGSYGLDIVERTVTLGTQQVRVRSFVDPNNPNGATAPLVGPTLTLTGNGQPVQNVTVRLKNRLAPEHDHTHGGVETPHGFNTTNLHTHGLHVAPDQDNVYVELAPSNGNAPACVGPVLPNPVIACTERYDYKYAFGQTPTGTTKLPAGTYWYHPHKHGSVGLQVASGMSGALIVRGDLDAIPGVAGLTEQVMVLQYVEYTTLLGSTVATVNPVNFYKFTTPTNQQLSINGQINPTVAMQYGEIQRWRIVNATAEQFFYLSLATPPGTAIPTPQMYAIATDGVPLTNSSTMAVPYLLGTPSYTAANLADVLMNEVAVLAPGQRLDLLVRMPAATGTPQPVSIPLQAVQFPSVAGGIASQTIATIQVAGAKATPDAMPANAAFNAGALVRPTIALPATLPPANRGYVFGFTPNSSVNNLQFAIPPNTQINLKLNALDVWAVSGYGNAQHAFHIHINSFLMSQRNGVSILPAAIWRDTARIDPSDGIPATTTPPILPAYPAIGPAVEFVSQQVDYTGDFVMHCHVLQHEDTGMMLSVGITS